MTPRPSDPLLDFATALEEMSGRGRRRQLRTARVEGPFLIVDGGTQLLNFGGNDYLGVVADALVSCQPESSPAYSSGTRSIPGGATASALVCGWTPQHARLAASIAQVESVEAAVVFPSGYAACSGSVATLCRAGDLILSDELNHASLIDGCRSSRAHRVVYPHRDVSFVRDFLAQNRDPFVHAWIVTDGVFSMDGDIAPLSALADLADQYRATLIVDEAHGTGVLGDRGSGLCEALGLQNRITIRIGTLSKAVGHQGGFVVGPKVVIDYLIQFCRPLIYSTALAPVTAAGACEVIEQMADWHGRRAHVASLARHTRQRLQSDTSFAMNVESADSLSELESGIPIVPLIVGSDEHAVALSGRLREQGFFVPAIRPPTVPEGTARLRLSLSAAHQMEHIDSLIDAIVGVASSRP